MIGYVLSWVLVIYGWILMARAIGSWILMANQGRVPAGLDGVWRLILALTDPPLRFIGRWVRPVRLGDISLDLAFLVLIVLLWLAQRFVAMFITF